MPIMDPEQYLIADEMCVLDVSKAERELGWVPQYRDEDMLIAAYTRISRRRTATPIDASMCRPNRSLENDHHEHAATGSSPHRRSRAGTRSAKHAKPNLLTVEDAKALDVAQMKDLFKAHINPGQLHFMKLLGFHKIKVERAEGMYYIDQNGRKILDFFGGFGSLAFGHNHPRILEARQKFQDEKRHEIASPSCRNMRRRSRTTSPPARRAISTWCSSARPARRRWKRRIKVAERAAGPEAVEDRLCREFLPRQDQGRALDHRRRRSTAAVQAGRQHRAGAVRRHRRGRAAPSAPIRRSASIVLETIQGGGGIVQAEPDFWQKLRALCDKYGVLWVADEVQCGYGRTGRFYAFEHYGVVPDVTALAKSLGGGKAAIGAMIASRERLHEGLWHAEDAR